MNNDKGQETHYYSTSAGLHFKLVLGEDSWWSIYLKNAYSGDYMPQIQAKDYDHAKAYCDALEPVTVPLQRL